MAATVQVGTILIENRPLILRELDLESEFYAGRWGVLRSHTRTTLDQRMRSTGWNYFFMTAELKSTVFGKLAAKNIRRALRRIFAETRKSNHNCLEITKIVEQRFWGVPYITVSAASRHIQQGFLMKFGGGTEKLQTSVK